jgi:23S rRNA (uridine2552-2'-O)-methyltransferase
MTVRARHKKVNRAWLHEHLTDPYVKQAQKDGYRARAAYKLEEIDEVFRLVKPGQVIVDLGAAPGAWSQYLQRRLATLERARPATRPGAIVALDMLAIEPIEGVRFVQGDFREDAVLAALEAALGERCVDLVVSDMAPNLSGIASADAARMADLVELALDFASQRLVDDGAMVAKVFHGSGYSQLVEAFKGRFSTVRAHKPKASRGRSAETFLVGLGLRVPANRRGGTRKPDS